MGRRAINIIDLPNDILFRILKRLSVTNRIISRETSKIMKENVSYMKIKIDKFNIKLSQIMIPFPMMDSLRRDIQVGLIIEWQSRLSLRRYNHELDKGKYKFIKNYIYRYLGQSNSISYSSRWFYDAIIDWMILEKEGIIKLR